MCAAALVGLVLACAATVPAIAAGAADDVGASFLRGSQWMSLRAGYAKASGEVAPNGLLGAGFGYRRFVLDKWSVGGFVHYELLGRFGRSADIEVPITLEVLRHSRWGAALFPYVGVGAGAFYHKRYRTGSDESGFTPGRYLVLGAHTPVTRRGLLGLDVRMAQVDKLDSNPAFPGPDPSRLKIDDWIVGLQHKQGVEIPLMFNENDPKTRLLWSVKFDYTITY
jgi:hypothetical protein